ncbi:MAG: hypothetical protein KGL02_10055, partial [Acidobacteriota bacterium]|nr:hypothetical protein [Acidobacteriota bacterium]
IVEIGTTFREYWDGIFLRYLAKDFRKSGLNRSDARRAARSAIEELRKIGSIRMRDPQPSKQPVASPEPKKSDQEQS